jgi:lysophospholipase L1-like esterase
MNKKIQLKTGQTILFTGDSITDARRRHPSYAPLGEGYVHFLTNLIQAAYPHLDLSFINTGVSGNTSRDLKARWQEDCIDHNPDVLALLIGINDLWRSLQPGPESAAGVPPDEYHAILYDLLTAAKDKCNCSILLIEPFMFCDDPQNQMFQLLPAYQNAIAALALEFNAVRVPLQEYIDRIIPNVTPSKWSPDTVHPETWAHAWIARACLGFFVT